MAEDSQGNSYAPITFGGEAIAKISKEGFVSAFYLSNTTATNATAMPNLHTSLASLPQQNKLVVTVNQQGIFVTFNTKSSSPHPTAVKIKNMPSNYTSIACDAIITPTRYPDQQIILCAEDFLGGNGAVTVFQSKDNWKSASYLGVVLNELKGVITAAPVEIAGQIFYLPFVANDGGSFSSDGKRASFPFIEITEQVDKIVREGKCE
ncbi:putative tri14-like protein [Fusarium bulbicola]|nr:putative tri14-like protein [Fusarium bulbicola]